MSTRSLTHSHASYDVVVAAAAVDADAVAATAVLQYGNAAVVEIVATVLVATSVDSAVVFSNSHVESDHKQLTCVKATMDR